MSMIQIGTLSTTPASCLVGIQDISKAERNARGDMIIERIATKRKLELSWGSLSPAELQQLFQAVAPVFFTVSYPDPQDGIRRTGTFYCGDRSVEALDYWDGQIHWKGIKFNLVER